MSEPNSNHVTISLRVSSFLWADEERRRQLRDMLSEYSGALDEVAFFTGFTHPPLPLLLNERLAKNMVQRA